MNWESYDGDYHDCEQKVEKYFKKNVHIPIFITEKKINDLMCNLNLRKRKLPTVKMFT